jgi:hypothetical protein
MPPESTTPPKSTGDSLPADVKTLTELPDPLGAPVIPPPKK